MINKITLKKTAFTICANNYLAHAKTLSNSFKRYHPAVDFFIVVLDLPNNTVTYNSLGADGIVWAHEVLGSMVKELSDTYGIAELCTVVKPKMYEYFYNQGFETVLYIDPDIQVFSEFKEVFKALETYDVVLTPHICSPTGDVGHPLDKDLMRTGIYNLGFLAMNKAPQTLEFLAWWHKRVVAYGFHDLKKGYFYDQIWLGYAPAFLDKVYVLRHLGYNVANWNLHERVLMEKAGTWYVNTETIPLRFFHFSHYKIGNEPIVASYNTNFTLENRHDIVPIYKNYKLSLEEAAYHDLKNIDYVFGKRPRLAGSEKISQKPTANKFKRVAYLFKRMVKIILGKE